MNLVGPATLPDAWERHFRDSAQLLRLAPRATEWLDIGSGAGFPALVLAALGVARVHLVESVAKKCRFLSEAADVLEVVDRVAIHNVRIENIQRFPVRVITARACAALGQLFDWGLRFAVPETIWLLPKGARVDEELAEARRAFAFEARLEPSLTSEAGRIVVAKNVRCLKGQK